MTKMKIGRNDPCHCGSGQKYERCCQEKDETAERTARAAAEAAKPKPPPRRSLADLLGEEIDDVCAAWLYRFWYQHRLVPLAVICGLAFTTAVFASTDTQSTTERLFANAAKDVVKRSSIAIYVPVSLQSLDTAAIDGCVFSKAERDKYAISIYGRVTQYGQTEPLPCEANDAAFLAEIHGDSTPMSDLSKKRNAQKVALQSGTSGWFIPVTCGGSCAPATLYWQTPKASYFFQLKLESKVPVAEQRSQLLKIVDSLQLIR